jgi:hypothetical protein
LDQCEKCRDGTGWPSVKVVRRLQALFYKASGSAIAAASPDAVWRIVTQIGGENRYLKTHT